MFGLCGEAPCQGEQREAGPKDGLGEVGADAAAAAEELVKRNGVAGHGVNKKRIGAAPLLLLLVWPGGS